MKTRLIEHRDRERIQEIVRAVGNFNEAEIIVAMELVDDAIQNRSTGDYIAYVLEDDSGILQGYTCYGLTPMTNGTYDIYWLAVDPYTQGRGYGRELISCVETEIRKVNGRLIVLETSSQDSYDRTRKFYENCGYFLAASLRDFYKIGDHKLIYLKYLNSNE